ncbi:glycosyltransferase family 4 protein [Mycolicibacterium vanbaalenii]|uniref:glycosyltransferase family 4 protein n=1 Tax=Mycolicibacterium vanbaalenii TaxID=110539 RepID=UPI0023BAEE28|nr:glycosyltransferase family 4 protein [Mycolicibacterium vanbaalenii]
MRFPRLRSPTGITNKATNVENREIWIVQRRLAHYRLPVFDRLAERLRELGFSLKIIFDPEQSEGPDDLTRPYSEPIIRIREYRHAGATFWRASALVDELRSRRPSAVIVEGTPRILTNFRVPHVMRALGGVALFWAKGHTEEGTPGGYLSDKLRFWFASLFDGAIVYGHAGKLELERIGITSSRVTVARNTIDTSRIFAELHERAARAAETKRTYGIEGRRVVLICGTMYPKKRHLDLVEAWPAIHAANPDAVLVMVGGGEMLEVVRRRVVEIGCQDVHVLGRVPEGEDYRWIGACDVSVLCGGLGLAIQQTLAFGRPMIVADEPGVDGEIVQHGTTGWRYPKGDVGALAATVNAVLADPEGSARIAGRGQDLIRNEVNIEGMVSSFLVALQKAGVL